MYQAIKLPTFSCIVFSLQTLLDQQSAFLLALYPLNDTDVPVTPFHSSLRRHALSNQNVVSEVRQQSGKIQVLLNNLLFLFFASLWGR